MGDIPLTGSSLQHQEFTAAQRFLLNNVSALTENLAAMGKCVSAHYYTHLNGRHSKPLVRPGWTTKRLYHIKEPDVEEVNHVEQTNSIPLSNEKAVEVDGIRDAVNASGRFGSRL